MITLSFHSSFMNPYETTDHEQDWQDSKALN